MISRYHWLCAFALLPFSSYAAEMLTYSSGTGFFVSREGYIVTNYHVIKDCNDINVSGSVPLSVAKLIAQDIGYDLALLKTRAMAIDEAKLSSTKQPVRANDPVVVVGYPGQSWQTGQPKTREARIISTKGPRGEEKWLEFSDALAQGNSGGPLLDSAGNVVGVVAAKGKLVSFNEVAAREETVDAFDLAISLPVLRQFLRGNSVSYREADSGIYLSSGHIADDARRYVVNVRCQLHK
jgi:S1-C subfamily serine protease